MASDLVKMWKQSMIKILCGGCIEADIPFFLKKSTVTTQIFMW